VFGLGQRKTNKQEKTPPGQTIFLIHINKKPPIFKKNENIF
jgi:hypothetical protein